MLKAIMKNITAIIALIIIGWILFFIFNPKNEQKIVYKDSNVNNIWDDVEPSINKIAENQNQKKALEFEIEAYQKALLDPLLGLKIKSHVIHNNLTQSGACLDKVWGTEAPPSDSIKDAILTSEERLKAWIEFNKNLSGGVYSLWDEEKDGNPCPFDINLNEK